MLSWNSDQFFLRILFEYMPKITYECHVILHLGHIEVLVL